jgi:hypothetical protein
MGHRSKTIKDSNGNDIVITAELTLERGMNGKRTIEFTASQNKKTYIQTCDLKQRLTGKLETDYIKELDSIFIRFTKQYFSELNTDDTDILTQLGYK